VRILLIVNTSASSVTARTRVVIGKALAADHRVTVAETSRRGHATRLAQSAAASGADVVVVLGGDGTLNEAANGLAGTPTALGALPGGSTNVFARTIGMTNDPIEATGELLGALARGSVRPIGLGRVNGRYFLFHVGIGFDAAVVDQVERRSHLKRYAGHPLFVYAGFSTWFRHYDRSRPHLTLALEDPGALGDGGRAVPGYFAICLNSTPYTFLGSRRLNLAPDAAFDQGLVVLNFRTIRFWPVLGVLASALGSGDRIRHHRRVDYHRDVGRAVVTASGEPLPYQVDGDYVGEVDRLVVEHEPEALRLVMP